MTVNSTPSSKSDQPSNFMDIFDDPDNIGAAEYRAVYEMVAEVDIDEPDETIGILEEVISWANYMILKIRDRYPASEETT